MVLKAAMEEEEERTKTKTVNDAKNCGREERTCRKEKQGKKQQKH